MTASLEFLDYHGNHAVIKSSSEPCDHPFLISPFGGAKHSAGDLIDYAMEMALLDTQALHEIDKPWIIGRLHHLKSLVNKKLHFIDAISSLIYPSNFTSISKNPVVLAEIAEAINYISRVLIMSGLSSRSEFFNKESKSDLSRLVFGRASYTVKLPDDVRMIIDGDISEYGAEIYVTQKRFHLSTNLHDDSFSDVFYLLGREELRLPESRQVSFPCVLQPSVQNSNYGRHYSQGHREDVQIPIKWVTGTFGLDFVNGKQVFVKHPFDVKTPQVSKKIEINTDSMLHNQVKMQMEKKKEEWIDDFGAEAYRAKIMKMCNHDFQFLLDAKSDLRRISKSRGSMEAWIKKNLGHIHPAIIFYFEETSRTPELTSILMSKFSYDFDQIDADVINKSTDSQSIWNLVISKNPSLFKYVPEEYESTDMGRSIESRKVTELDIIFKAHRNIFSDNVVIEAASRRENSFNSLKKIPGHLITEGNILSIVGKNGFNPSDLSFDFSPYMNKPAIHKVACRIPGVKKWLRSKDNGLAFD